MIKFIQVVCIFLVSFMLLTSVLASEKCCWCKDCNRDLCISSERWSVIKIAEGDTVAMFCLKPKRCTHRLVLQSTLDIFDGVAFLNIEETDSVRKSPYLGGVLKEGRIAKIGIAQARFSLAQNHVLLVQPRCSLAQNHVLLIQLVEISDHGQITLALRAYTPGTKMPDRYHP